MYLARYKNQQTKKAFSCSHRYCLISAVKKFFTYPYFEEKLLSAYATHLLEGGLEMKYIQEFLGHTFVTNTEVYTRVSPDALFRVYRATR